MAPIRDLIARQKSGDGRVPVLRLHTEDLIVDNFAGGGGASHGIEWALGRSPDIAVNHDPEAILMHKANHPDTKHFCESVFTVNPKKVCKGKRVALAWFSPDCFPAGTMVLTQEGYRPIEELQVGDEVLTHKQRWRKVTRTYQSEKPLVRIRGMGHPGLLVSPEHPFLTRKRNDVYSSEPPRGYRRRLQPEEDWTRAGDLEKGYYWASPTVFPEAEVPSVPVYRQRETLVSANLMWLAGRYVADGWTRLTDTRAEIVITCGHHKTEALRAKINIWPRSGARAGSDELAWQERDTYTAHQFTTAHRGLVEWLREHFGHGAAEKKIPGWVLGMSATFRNAFLEGYLSGDGCVSHGTGSPLTIASTVSKALAFGLKALASTFGWAPQIALNENPTTIIQGRKVNARPAWSVKWRVEPDEKHIQTFQESNLIWAPIRERQDDVCDLAEVFNIAVEEDESYVVDGIIVHNCTFHSKARGGKPFRDRDAAKRRRGLAWVVTAWAKAVKPKVIVLENVEEFQDWGPLTDDGVPDPERKGKTFQAWLSRLRNLGYDVEMRELRGCDYGAPTIRKRLFVIARNDGLPIEWPIPTHGPNRGKIFRTAADCIDWAIPTRSIFGREKPLAENTLRRIARGIMKYVIQAKEPFIIPLTHAGDTRSHPISEPFRTVTGAHRGEMAVVAPTLMKNMTNNVGQDVREPLSTTLTGNHHYLVKAELEKYFTTPFLTGAGGPSYSGKPTAADVPFGTVLTESHKALIVPTLIQTSWGERKGQAPRVPGLEKPLGTIMAEGGKHALVAAFLAKHNAGHEATGQRLDKVVDTVTCKDSKALVTCAGIATSHLMKLYGTAGAGAPVTEPMPTVTGSGQHIAEVRAFMIKYYGTDQDPQIKEPLHTVTTKDRFALIVTIHGEDYVIVDIGMRMLTPRELYRAQGFEDRYIIDPLYESGKKKGTPLTKTVQVRCAGNSVCPPLAAAIVRANFQVRSEEGQVAA